MRKIPWFSVIFYMMLMVLWIPIIIYLWGMFLVFLGSFLEDISRWIW
jgi:hypothetical protein